MSIVLLMEGYTERELPPFLKRWLDPRLAQRAVRISPVRYNGNGAYLADVHDRTHFHLQQPDTLAVFGLLDLYELKLSYPRNSSRNQRIAFARNHIVNLVDPADRPRFHQYFAVHEFEAWLLSDPGLFPSIKLPASCAQPEQVNDLKPPSKLLHDLLSRHGGRGYKKTTMARVLLPKLDPAFVYQKCPNFRAMLDDMLAVVP
jgi:Domain of unknown function (DUF4276)